MVEGVEVDVLRAAVGGAQLGARDREGRARLDEGQDAAAQPDDAVARRLGDRLDPAEVRRRVLPAPRAGEVDEPPRGERGDEAAARLLVEERPSPRR